MAINVLSPKIYNRIAAGEVVERPASVVKELVENCLDAGATKIKVEIYEGGIKKIVVSDNGCGISKEDLPLAFLPHATSKIGDLEDLDAIDTLGFRGEALASISSVSMVSLSTKTKGSETGWQVEANGGEISKIREVARVEGTTLTVQNLFYNTPARAKFLKKPKTEESEIVHLIEKFMFSHPEIDFEFLVDDKTIYNHNSGNLDEAIYLVYGKEVFDNLLAVDYKDAGVRVHGFVVGPKFSRPNRTYQNLFVNGRYVENYMVSACIQSAYEPFLMKGRFPIYVLNLEVDFGSVDVNVHPNKKEVKFENSNQIYGIVRRAVERALVSTNLIADFEVSAAEEKDWSKFSIKNDQNPTNTSFNSFHTNAFDKLGRNESVSGTIAVDVTKKTEQNIASEQDKKIEEKEWIVPDFSKIKGEPISKNKQGGNIFFDHPAESVLKEVEIAVEKNKIEQQPLEKTVVEEKFLQTKAEEIKIVGVVFKTYIITELEDAIYIVDQHAMHERQLYDKLKAEVDKNCVAKQEMLIPYAFDLNVKDSQIFENSIKNLKKIGFAVSQKGNHFEILSVPFVLSGIKLQKFVEEILAEDSLQEKTASSIINEKLCQTACKHAIRAGDSVSKEEILYLIEQMKEGIMLCPHGRPIVVKMTKKELEKMFKRVL